MKKPLMLTTTFISSLLPFAPLASAQPRDWGPGPWGYGMHYMWGGLGDRHVYQDAGLFDRRFTLFDRSLDLGHRLEHPGGGGIFPCHQYDRPQRRVAGTPRRIRENIGLKAERAPGALRFEAVGEDIDMCVKPLGGMKAPANAPVVPAVTGFSEGKRVLFIHTETSDPKIAKLLTDMMGGSPVLLVPSLAKVSKGLHAHVYVFANGLKPKGPRGPLGYQPDVFPNPPGSAGYSPLRSVVLVTWKDAASARMLKTAAEVESAIKKGELATKEPGIVVNMPFLTWPGGKR